MASAVERSFLNPYTFGSEMVSAFERELICERTAAGRVAAKNRGVRGGVRFGRPLKLNSEQQKLAHRLIAEGKPVSEIAKIFGVHVTTIYRMSSEQA